MLDQLQNGDSSARNWARGTTTWGAGVLTNASVQKLEVNMKKFALAAALSLAATATFAGGYEEPIIEPVIIEEETGSSGGGIWVPLLIFAVIAAAAAGHH